MANNDPVRWTQRLEHFERACDRLDEAITVVDPSPLERTGLIKHYEMAFELGWKTLKDLLGYEGYEEVGSPKTTLRTAHGAGWIDDIDAWLRMLEYRNRATHVYDEAEAEFLDQVIRETCATQFETLRQRLAAKAREGKESASNEQDGRE